jgi:hypothetical protein
VAQSKCREFACWDKQRVALCLTQQSAALERTETDLLKLALVDTSPLDQKRLRLAQTEDVNVICRTGGSSSLTKSPVLGSRAAAHKNTFSLAVTGHAQVLVVCRLGGLPFIDPRSKVGV